MPAIKSKEFIRVLGLPTVEPGTYNYITIGKGLESLPTSMGADVQKTKDVLGNVVIAIGGYDKSATISPYVCNSDDDLYIFLQDIIDNERTLDDLNVVVLDVKLYETDQLGAYPAIREDGVIEITDYNREVSGYQINFNLHFKGNPAKGTFDPSAKTWVPAV